MNLRTLNNQRGIALGPLLFIIGILAIIAAAIAAGSSAFNANTTTENTKSIAETIIQQADQINMAVQRVRVDNSCGDSQISFSVTSGDGYTNPNAPSNGLCNVFDPRGGGAIWPLVPKGANDGSAYAISGGNSVDSLGCSGSAACSELMLVLPNVTNAVCSQLNQITAGTSVIPLEWTGEAMDTTPYTGTYLYDNYIDAYSPYPGMVGRMQLCVTANNGASLNYFYAVFIVN